MGFLSFHEKYYSQKLLKLENEPLSNKEIYEVKQILKLLDDLEDEGYTNLNNHLESRFSCLSRLRHILQKFDEKPFLICKEQLPEVVYEDSEYELTALLRNINQKARVQPICSDNPFLIELKKYCNWIGYNEDTAYVFLLRDTLLPYIYYQSKKRKHLYPWLISRKFLHEMTSCENIDDDLRVPIYEALETGYVDFRDFVPFCKERILAVLNKHMDLKNALLALLNSIPENNIVVIESGYCGTIPMLLSAMDNRINFKLFTTAPFLYDTYRSNIYCKRYEDLRLFETLSSQDLLLQLSSFRDNKFYVTMVESKKILKRSLAEIKCMIN